MLTKFQHHLAFNNLIDPTDRILLAVSGGIDSMVMLRLFQMADFKIAVAHCNFGLRGKESDADEAFVKNKCTIAGVPFFSKRFETNNYAAQHGVSIQMAARAMRYQWFDALMKSEGLTKLATAHHLQDALETVLLNFSRGTGLDGMQGIVAINGNRIRPLLFAAKYEIESFAAEEQIAWREDESNQTEDYQRNFIRHKILPQFKALNPSLLVTFSDYQLKMGAAREFSQWGISEWKRKYWSESDGRIKILKTGLLAPHAAGLLWEVLKSYGFHLDQLRELTSALTTQSGKRFLSDRYEIFIDRDEVIIMPVTETIDDCVEIEKSGSEVVRHNQKLTITFPTSFLKTTAKEVACIDAEKIHYPLVWRKWKYGDSFFPLGMNHRKKVSDFLIDQKISLPEKKNITVIESAGEIIWLVGYRLDDRFKVTDSTRLFLELTVSKLTE